MKVGIPGIGKNGILFIAVFIWSGFPRAEGQYSHDAHKIIKHLGSSCCHGRGYAKSGDVRASRYISDRLRKSGTGAFASGYFQPFILSVNTFPGKMNLRVNGRLLVPARDYLVDPASPGLFGKFVPVFIRPSDVAKGPDGHLISSMAGGMAIADSRGMAQLGKNEQQAWKSWIDQQVRSNPYGLKALAEITEDRLIFGTATGLNSIPHFVIRAEALPDSVESCKAGYRNEYLKDHLTRNVAGYVPGTVCPDSFVVFTAHYDHLGLMGRKTYFPGANDNASGVAMVLGLARYFSAHPQRFSVVFLFFAGEEAGLLGSGFFADHPLVALDRIKFLLNFDLVGTGQDGITVVNASEFARAYGSLEEINQSGEFVKTIRKRGKACISDHCPFTAKGVPCFYIYTLGGIAAYHDLDDRPETLPLTAFDGLNNLIISFVHRL